MAPPGSLSLGKIGPIPISAHWTSLLLVWLAWSGTGGDTALFLAVLLALVLGIVLHECGHGFAALWFKARNVSITLWAFGGVCMSQRDTRRPWAEVAILAAGPAVSFLLAGIGLGSVYIMEGTVLPEKIQSNEGGWPISVLLLWILGAINLALGLFNCIPLFPLDGGQIVYQMQRGLQVPDAIARKVSLTLAIACAAGVLVYFHLSGGLSIFNVLIILFLLKISYDYLHRRPAEG